MAVARAGDRVIVESEHIGESSREGEILEVLGVNDGLHYRVRWDDGHESIFFPSGGSITVVPKVTKTSSSG